MGGDDLPEVAALGAQDGPPGYPAHAEESHDGSHPEEPGEGEEEGKGGDSTQQSDAGHSPP